MIVAADEKGLERAAEVVTHGGVIGFRTDTFYGLGADPFNRQALNRINRLKDREGQKPILVVISDLKQVERFVLEKSNLYEMLTEKYWPGPLTLVAKSRAEVPEGLTKGTESIGLRLPHDPAALKLIRACGGALTATSANRAGEPPARTAQAVVESFPTELDLILDGGETRAEAASTVLDVSGERIALIREGVISRVELQQTLKSYGYDLKL